MQFGHRGRARRLVQAVHVLGDDPGQQPAAAELGHGAVAAFGTARAMCRQPRWLRAQYLRRAAALPVKVW